MRVDKKLRKIVVGSVVFIVAALLVYYMSRPEITLQQYEIDTYKHDTEDKILENEGRHCGWINLQKFVDLAARQGKLVFDPSKNVSRSRDSVVISARRNNIFFGKDDGKWWVKRYKNLPITFPDINSFKAKIKEENDVEYIYIPYQILSNLAAASSSRSDNKTPTPMASNSEENKITIKSKSDIQKKLGKGKKIQTEGIIFSHTTDILVHKGSPNDTKKEQMETLWRHVKDNWIYINDPHSDHDTWRSAQETIENYYFNNSLKYCGDCDDFAIVMASLANQIGYESRVTVVLGQEGGHAYAEFNDNGKWIPLDWFSNKFGGPPYEGEIKYHLTDI